MSADRQVLKGRLITIAAELTATIGVFVWSYSCCILLGQYLKAQCLAGAAHGPTGMAIAELDDPARALSTCLALTLALCLILPRYFRGANALPRVLPAIWAVCAAVLLALTGLVHLVYSTGADPSELTLSGGLTWPLLILASAVVVAAGAIAALIARITGSRFWRLVFFGLPAAAAVAFFALVSREIAAHGVADETSAALPLIFPRLTTLAATLGALTAVLAALYLGARRASLPDPQGLAIMALAPWLYAWHVIVCGGTAAPFTKLCAFIVDDPVRDAGDRLSWIIAGVFALVWIGIFQLQRRRARPLR